jgi:hypothetical protein
MRCHARRSPMANGCSRSLYEASTAHSDGYTKCSMRLHDAVLQYRICTYIVHIRYAYVHCVVPEHIGVGHITIRSALPSPSANSAEHRARSPCVLRVVAHDAQCGTLRHQQSCSSIMPVLTCSVSCMMCDRFGNFDHVECFWTHRVAQVAQVAQVV